MRVMCLYFKKDDRKLLYIQRLDFPPIRNSIHGWKGSQAKGGFSHENGYNSPMQKQILPIFLCLVLLAACGKTPAPTQDLVGTQVSLVLTGTAAALPTLPPVVSTSTQPPLVETPLPTLTPTAILTPTVTASPTSADDPLAALGTPTWTSNLDNVSSWYTEDNDYSNIRGENGALLLTSKQSIGWHSWSMHYHSLTNYYLDARIKVGVCTGNDLYGLVFRSPDTSSGYFYTLTCDGRAALRSFNGSEFTKVADFTASDAILAGSNQINRLGVRVEGSTITLYANNQKVLEVTDTTFSSGTFGVFISAVNTPGFQIALDEISYWILP